MDKVVKFVAQHVDRIICEEVVFRMRPDGKIVFMQNLQNEFNGILCALGMSDGIMLTGHPKFGTICIWQWDDLANIYTKVKSGNTVWGSQLREHSVSMLRRYPVYSDQPNVLFVVYASRNVYQLNLNATRMKTSTKRLMNTRRGEEKVVDYTVIDKNTIIILLDFVIIVVDILTQCEKWVRVLKT